MPNDFPFFIQDATTIQSVKLAGWNETSAYANKAVLPQSFFLKTAPNPFNPGCNISFSIKESVNIDIALFDAIIGEITSIFTIRMLLNEKTFNKNYINLDNEII